MVTIRRLGHRSVTGGLSDSAKAADFLGIPSIPGPFEMNPKDAVVIGARNVTSYIFTVIFRWDDWDSKG